MKYVLLGPCRAQSVLLNPLTFWPYLRFPNCPVSPDHRALEFDSKRIALATALLGISNFLALQVRTALFMIFRGRFSTVPGIRYSYTGLIFVLVMNSFIYILMRLLTR